jgi:hypothetical protein
VIFDRPQFGALVRAAIYIPHAGRHMHDRRLKKGLLKGDGAALDAPPCPVHIGPPLSKAENISVSPLADTDREMTKTSHHDTLPISFMRSQSGE